MAKFASLDIDWYLFLFRAFENIEHIAEEDKSYSVVNLFALLGHHTEVVLNQGI